MATLTTEQYRQVKEDVVIAARRQNIARKLMSVRGPMGLGVQQYSYDTLTELSAAIVSYAFEERDLDKPSTTRTSTDIPILQKSFEIQRRDMQSSQRFGTPLNTAAAASASYRVAYQENAMVLDGWSKDSSTYDIKGAIQTAAAGNTDSSANGFNTAGNAIEEVAICMGLLLADDIPAPYNLVLNPTQYAELVAAVLSNGDREITHVREIIGGEIYVSQYQTAGTGTLLAMPEAKFFELVVATDMSVETEELPKSHNTYGRVYECVVPVFYDTNAVCTMTAI